MDIYEADLWDLGEYHFEKIWYNTTFERRIKKTVRNYFPDVAFFRGTLVDQRDWTDYFAMIYDDTERWHHDDYGQDEWLVLWANHNPTEIKRPQGLTAYQLKPYHFYLMNNKKWMHRAPKIRNTGLNYPRKFLRAYIKP